ncbi:MAG: matrixin family metalloprotease [Oligoflexia bacterium]|nr:matrixin family metalloprotease [Oligoflexia bacterium]
MIILLVAVISYFFEIFCFNCSDVYGFVRTRNLSGTPIYWRNKSINLYVDSTNSYNISSDAIMGIVERAAREWSGKSEININVYKNTAVNSSGSYGNNKRSDIYFGKSATFSRGVLGVTSVSYIENSGEISEADISLNQALLFGRINVNSLYPPTLADVVTHEMGHVVGLDHSQIKDSSMLYMAFVGQHTLDTDDTLGIFNVAPNSSTLGIIRGKVVGGKSLAGIFAAQVQIVSMKEGRVIAGVFTEDSGKFEINGLPLGDTYFIYVNPVNVFASVPDYYLSSSNKFCSGSSYRGGFFSKCDTDDEGYPQGIYLGEEEKTVDVGNVTAKCKIDSPSDYLDEKDFALFQNTSTRDFSLNMVPDGTSNGYGTAMVGFFSKKEISLNIEDVISIDISNYSVNSQNEYYLELRLVSQNFFSPLRTIVNVKRNGVLQGTYPESSGGIALDGDGRPYVNLGKDTRIRLSNISSENKFEVRIKPVEFTYNNSTYVSDSFYGINILDYFFPANLSFVEDVSFYLLIAYISKKESSSYSIVDKRNYKPYEDNKTCPDALGAYETKGFTGSSSSTVSSISSSSGTSKASSSGLGIFGCGMINFIDGDRGGGSSSSDSGSVFYNILSMLIGAIVGVAIGRGVYSRKFFRAF